MKTKLFRFIDINLIMIVFGFYFIALDSNQIIAVRILSVILATSTLISLFRSWIDRSKLINYQKLMYSSENKNESEMNDKEFQEFLDLKGRKLEYALEVSLKNIYKKNLIIFKDVNIPTNNKKKTQIDLIAMINNKIFVFEVKAYATTLQGNWNDERLNTDYKNVKSIKNPIKQNKYHIEQLSQITMPNLDYFGSIIVFGDFTKYSTNQYPPKNTRVIKLKDLKINIEALGNKLLKFDNDGVNEVIEDLKKYSTELYRS